MTGGLLLALLLAAQPAAAAPAGDLDRYREIVTATWWTECCAQFQGGVPHDIERRIELVSDSLGRRYGRAATASLVAAARTDFNGRLALYDPVARRYSPRQQQRFRRAAWRWYDARLDALEARLGLGLGASPSRAAPPSDLAQLYRMANAYETAANRRICADASLRPRLAATARRLAQARQRMISAYGREFLSAAEAPVIFAGDPCTEPGAAANAISGFESAVSRLEAGLNRTARR
jgi:hypothetical protein